MVSHFKITVAFPTVCITGTSINHCIYGITVCKACLSYNVLVVCVVYTPVKICTYCQDIFYLSMISRLSVINKL